MKKANLLNKNKLIFRQKLLKWHISQNNRLLPWKGIKDVYKIWLSEIILQQTRVEQGLAYYEKFINTYPTVFDLAKANESSVMKLWEGLGYYNRCKNLHYTAKQIAYERSGKFPNTYEELLTLKGVGAYTAAAIASFAYNLPIPVIDGNVKRVLSRFFGIEAAVDSNEGKKQIESFANECIDVRNPSVYNQAIMDLGATVCKPANPLCHQCPLKKNCYAFIHNAVNRLPLTEKKIVKKARWFVFLIIRNKNKIAVTQRNAGDIWAGLYSFPVLEFGEKKEWMQCLKQLNKNNIETTHEAGRMILDKVIPNSKKSLMQYFKIEHQENTYMQLLTHQKIHANAVKLELIHPAECSPSLKWIHLNKIREFAFPKIIRQIIDKEMS